MDTAVFVNIMTDPAALVTLVNNLSHISRRKLAPRYLPVVVSILLQILTLTEQLVGIKPRRQSAILSKTCCHPRLYHIKLTIGATITEIFTCNDTRLRLSPWCGTQRDVAHKNDVSTSSLTVSWWHFRLYYLLTYYRKWHKMFNEKYMQKSASHSWFLECLKSVYNISLRGVLIWWMLLDRWKAPDALLCTETV